ncbi:MAG: phage virion morphogenesis protein [Odoribacter sp.]
MANKPLNNLPDDLRHKLRMINQAVKRDIPIVIGKTAVDQFRENFRLEGFLNGGLHKWKDVKRRDSKSPWYGFEYKGEHRTSYKLSRDRKTGKTKKAQKQKLLNFSVTATVRKPLSSKRMELYNSLRYTAGAGMVSISSDKPYAQVHNEGGTIQVFGKHPVKLPARPFMGQSKELDTKVSQEIEKQLNNIFNQQ